jgi:HEAT repeat protein
MRGLSFLVPVAAVLTCATARAENATIGGKAGQAPTALVAPATADVTKRLKSGEAAQIKSALDDVRVEGRSGAWAVGLIADLLRAGLSPTLTRAALETLGDTESEGAGEVLAMYSRHRDLTLRRAAVEALTKTGGDAATRALRRGLSDADPAVRGVSATALRARKAREAVPELLAALDRNVPEASASIGVLCAPADCERLVGKLGSLPFDVVMAGIDEILTRPVAEVGDDLKVKIVGRVRELGTAEVNHFLKGVQTRWPARASHRVKQAIDQAVLATAGSPGSDGSEVAR